MFLSFYFVLVSMLSLTVCDSDATCGRDSDGRRSTMAIAMREKENGRSFVVGLHHNCYGGKISLFPPLFLCESMLGFSKFIGLVGGFWVLIS
jgi:hypothetical protein